MAQEHLDKEIMVVMQLLIMAPVAVEVLVVSVVMVVDLMEEQVEMELHLQ